MEGASHSSCQVRLISRLSGMPWWLLLVLLAGVVLSWRIATDALYSQILGRLAQGLFTTLWVSAASFILALGFGLVAGLGRVSENRGVREAATLYVQVIRGIPILVQVFYVAFVVVPALVWLGVAAGDLLTGLGLENPLAGLRAADVPMGLRVVLALAFAYGGFEAETIRAGIEAVPKGQMDAARSLGLTRFQAMRHVILPQGLRKVLPTLGNDLISLVKDSSLVSVLGVGDVTQEARLYMSSSFHYPETLNMLAFIYLVLTLLISLGVKGLERWKENHDA